MKILIICNNHNSIKIVRCCVNLEIFKSGGAFITCLFDSKALAKTYHLEFGNVNISYFILSGNNVGACDFNEDVSLNIPMQEQKIQKKPLGLIIPKIVSESTFFYKARELRISRKLSHYKNIMKSFLSLNDIDTVLSLSDRTHDYIESATLHAAKSLGIKVVIPFVAHFDVDASLEYRKDKYGKFISEIQPFNRLSIYKTLSYFRLKKQLYRGVFFQAPFILNAHRKQKTLSAYPWWSGNGNSDIVCVDNKYTYQKYIKHRVPIDKLVIVGHQEYNDLFIASQNKKQILKELNHRHGFDPRKKLVILSLPQHAEQGYYEWDTHEKKIRQLLKQIINVDCNFLISLHPRQDPLDYSFIIDEYNLNFADEPLSKIIATADIFIASNSTTSTWACLCGVPGLNLVGPINDLYEHLSSIVYVSDLNLISVEVKKILDNPVVDYNNDWKILSKDQVFNEHFNNRFQMLL